MVVASAASGAWLVSHAIGLGGGDVPFLLWNWLNRTFIFVVAAVFSDLLNHQMVLAQTDPLTSLPNRRARFLSPPEVSDRSTEARALAHSISLAYIDYLRQLQGDQRSLRSRGRGHGSPAGSPSTFG